MKPKLVIGNKNYSSWSLRAWLLIQKIDIDYDEVVVPLYTDTHHDQLLAYSAAALVPIYLEGDLAIWDSLAIAEYLAESHAELWPENKQVRAHARAICAECHSGFVALRSALPMNCRASNRKIALTENTRQDISRVNTILTECRGQYSNNGDWLFGQFSIADAFYAPIVSRFETYGIAELSDAARLYCRDLLNDSDMRRWYEAADAETWTIEASEAGQT